VILPLFFQAAAIAASEADFYKVDYLVPPQGERIEVGGFDFLPDGRLVCSTRRGQVWMVTNPLAENPADAKFSLFAEGLHEGLGLEVVNGEIFVLQRGELSKLVDEDKDGTCDRIDTFSQGWGYSGHYHEFGFGLPRDAQGNFYASLNVSFSDQKWWHGRSVAPYRGWVLRIKPDGSWEPVASGARSPAGLGSNSKGDIFYTDNQGDWMPACPIFHVKDGAFFGHPASLNWTPDYRDNGRTASDTLAPTVERARAAIWLPYDWSRSTGNLVEDTTGGKFGPFGGQMFVAEMTNGYVLRAGMETIEGEYQGWVVPFRHKVGSNVRLRFAPDGTLFCGFTDRGWGGQPPGDGIGRVRWNGKKPFEIENVHLIGDGFEIRFTDKVSRAIANVFAAAEVKQYDYNYWWEYGSPLQHVTPRAVLSTALSEDQRTVTMRIHGLEAGMVARVKLAGVLAESGAALLHDEFAYTINQLPGYPQKTAHVAKLVEQPEAQRERQRRCAVPHAGDALAAWNGKGWQQGEVKARRRQEEPRRQRRGEGRRLGRGRAQQPRRRGGGSRVALRVRRHRLLRAVPAARGREFRHLPDGALRGPAARLVRCDAARSRRLRRHLRGRRRREVARQRADVPDVPRCGALAFAQRQLPGAAFRCAGQEDRQREVQARDDRRHAAAGGGRGADADGGWLRR
jgi:hypothetical protein